MNDEVLQGIVCWFEGVSALLDKDSSFSTQELIRIIIGMVESVDAIAPNLGQDKDASPVMKLTGNMADAMIGIISICRGDFEGLERIAKIIGSYD